MMTRFNKMTWQVGFLIGLAIGSIMFAQVATSNPFHAACAILDPQ